MEYKYFLCVADCGDKKKVVFSFDFVLLLFVSVLSQPFAWPRICCMAGIVSIFSMRNYNVIICQLRFARLSLMDAGWTWNLCHRKKLIHLARITFVRASGTHIFTDAWPGKAHVSKIGPCVCVYESLTTTPSTSCSIYFDFLGIIWWWCRPTQPQSSLRRQRNVYTSASASAKSTQMSIL